MVMLPDLSTAGIDLLFDMHEQKLTSMESGATPAEVIRVELYNLARTIVAYADDEAQQQATLTFALEQLPALVYQLQQAERWRLASRGCLDR